MRALHTSLAIAALAATLAGCQSTDSPRAVHSRSMTGFATLASSGTFEEATAPVKTRAAKLAHNVNRLAAAKRIDADVADKARARASLAQVLILEAEQADRDGNAGKAADKLRWAKAAIEDGELALAVKK